MGMEDIHVYMVLGNGGYGYGGYEYIHGAWVWRI